MKILYRRGTRKATWENGYVTGDELMVSLLDDAALYAPKVSITPVGPHVVPSMVDHIGAWAAGAYLNYDMSGDYPIEMQVSEGATCGANTGTRIRKHLAGTKNDHDQSTHGRKGGGGTKPIKVPDTHGGRIVKDQYNEELWIDRQVRPTLVKMAEEFDADLNNNGDLADLAKEFHTDAEGFRKLYITASRDGANDIVDYLDSEGFGDEEMYDFWQRHARRKAFARARLGHSPTDLATGIDKVKAFLDDDGTNLFVRVDSDTMWDVLNEGRFYTQVRSGMSNGFYSPDARMRLNYLLFGMSTNPGLEEMIDGVPESHLYPIYGYAAGDPWVTDSLDNYGTVSVELNDNFKDSATVSLGDSLDDTGVNVPVTLGALPFGGHVRHAPVPFTNPGLEAMNGYLDRNIHYPDVTIDGLTRWGAIRYVEAQVHKPINFSLDDIEAVHVRAEFEDIELGYGSLWDVINEGIPVKVWSDDGTGNEWLRATLTEIDPETNEIVFPS